MSDAFVTPGRPATIHEVAAMFGVVVSTVSRAWSSYGRISAGTRKRVEQAAAALRYTPNRQACALIPGRKGYVGPVVPDLAAPRWLQLARALIAEFRAAGFFQLLVEADNNRGIHDELEQLCANVDGVVIAGSLFRDEELAALSVTTPLVPIGGEGDGLSNVRPGGASEPCDPSTLRQLFHNAITALNTDKETARALIAAISDAGDKGRSEAFHPSKDGRVRIYG